MLTGGSRTAETARFIELVDAFFDCLNVGNYTDGKRHRKMFQQPFRTANDFRFKVLLYVHTCTVYKHKCTNKMYMTQLC